MPNQNHGVVRQPTFSFQLGGKVFLSLLGTQHDLHLHSRLPRPLQRTGATCVLLTSFPAAAPKTRVERREKPA